MNKKEPTDKNLLIFFDDIEKVNNNSIYEVYSGRDGLTVIFNVNSDYDKFQVNKDLNNLLDKNFTKIPEIVDKGVKNKLYKILLNTNLSYTAYTARQEEQGSVWILNKAIANRERVKFSTVSDIKNNKDYNELEDIFGGKVPQDWLESYLKQQKKILEIYGDQKWQEFKYSGSGSFRQYIENKIRSLGITKYANWTPADIWLVQDQKKVETLIDSEIGKDGKTPTQTVYELNDILRKLFKEKKIVGISLKKVSGKFAIYEEVNVRIANTSRELRAQKKSYNTPKSQIKIKLDLSYISSKKSFNTQDLIVNLGAKFRFQIKSNSGNFRRGAFDNLKFEGTFPSYASARGGKVPVDKLSSLMKENGVLFNNKYAEYPKTLDEFKDQSQKFKTIFDKVRQNITTNIKNSNEFINIFTYMFSSSKMNASLANSKLMQLDFIYQTLKIKPSKKYEEFWTDLFWLSIRKGKEFAPHGKLY